MALLRSWIGALSRSRWGGLVLVGVGIFAIAVTMHLVESASRAVGSSPGEPDEPAAEAAPPEPLVPEIRKLDELTVAIILGDTITSTRMRDESETELYRGCVADELEALLVEPPGPDDDGEDVPAWLQHVREKRRLNGKIGGIQQRCIAAVRAERRKQQSEPPADG